MTAGSFSKGFPLRVLQGCYEVLGSWVRVPLLQLNSRKKGTTIIKGLLRNLGFVSRGTTRVEGMELYKGFRA